MVKIEFCSDGLIFTSSIDPVDNKIIGFDEQEVWEQLQAILFGWANSVEI